MRITDTSDMWWKTAVFYNLNVETFMDWDDDGVGDLEGLGQRLDYLEELGVTCIWLAPFYPSPRQDNGYDISDYFGVDERNGHLGDLVEMVRTAHDRGMRVIVDLVVNHTSIEHPWFQKARSSLDNRYRDYYTWRDDKPEDGRANMFPDREDGVWSYDEEAGQYYEHSFYHHQPDLDTTNPEVREEIAKVIGFWLQLGIDGFRVDAVPFLIQADGHNEHDYLRALRSYVGRRSGTGMLLGEVNLPYDEQEAYFGDHGNELTMQFDFVANQQLYLALARQDATPLARALAARPDLANVTQWANFVRNHDELTLDRSRTTNAARSSTRSRRSRRCGSTAGASSAGFHRCSATTRGASGWSTVCCSPCPARRCCTTGRRSGWRNTRPWRDAPPSAPRCNGRARSTAGSPMRTRTSCRCLSWRAVGPRPM
ncbi:alpha-amylase family glycosyl hydrolase [Arthrobacter ruber]|uniref:alpha-amylase family glycosyl hydrolase n=1 Tax=Arthrobacter ruber TaxID=1258893 RepID=UPI0030B82084